MNKNNKVKLSIAIVGLLAAGAILAWQFLPTNAGSDASKAPAEEIITSKARDGSIITKQGGRAMREPPPAK